MIGWGVAVALAILWASSFYAQRERIRGLEAEIAEAKIAADFVDLEATAFALRQNLAGRWH